MQAVVEGLPEVVDFEFHEDLQQFSDREGTLLERCLPLQSVFLCQKDRIGSFGEFCHLEHEVPVPYSNYQLIPGIIVDCDEEDIRLKYQKMMCFFDTGQGGKEGLEDP